MKRIVCISTIRSNRIIAGRCVPVLPVAHFLHKTHGTFQRSTTMLHGMHCHSTANVYMSHHASATCRTPNKILATHHNRGQPCQSKKTIVKRIQSICTICTTMRIPPLPATSRRRRNQPSVGRTCQHWQLSSHKRCTCPSFPVACQP